MINHALKIGVCGAILSGIMLFAGANQASADTNNPGQYKMKTANAYMISIDRADGVWSKPYGQEGANYLGKATDIQGQQIKAYGTYVDNNGTVWVQFDFKGQRAWVDANSVRNHRDYFRENTDKFDATDYVGKPARVNGKIVVVLDTYVDETGAKWASVSEGKDILNSTIDYNVQTQQVSVSATDNSYGLTIKNGPGAVWSKPYGLGGAEYYNATNNLAGQHFFADKIAYVGKDAQKWIHIDHVGWVHEDVLTWDNGQVMNTGTMLGRYGIVSYTQGPRSPFTDYLNEHQGVGSTIASGYDGSSSASNWYY